MTRTEKLDIHLENRLSKIGLDAILKHKNSKLWASVNSEDNFNCAMFSTAHDAVVGEVSKFLDEHGVGWFNRKCGVHTKKSQFDVFIYTICAEAYKLLNK